MTPRNNWQEQREKRHRQWVDPAEPYTTFWPAPAHEMTTTPARGGLIRIDCSGGHICGAPWLVVSLHGVGSVADYHRRRFGQETPP